MYKEVYGLRGYEVSKDSRVRSIRDKKQVVKKSKGKSGRIYIKIGGKYYRDYILMLKTYNKYGIHKDNMDRYDKLNKGHFKYADGNKSNLTYDNIIVTDMGKRALEYGNNPITSTHSKIIKNMWDYTENNKEGIYAKNYTYGSNKEVYWVCSEGHKFKQTIREYINKPICKECELPNNISLPQQLIYVIMKKNFRDVELEKRVGKYRVDVYIKDINLSIEYDGNYWHQSEERIIKDGLKEEYILKTLGGSVLRIREIGCGGLKSRGRVIDYDYNKDCSQGFNNLKQILYKEVKKLNKVVKKLEEGELEGLSNLIWVNQNNSLKETHPKLSKYFSKENKIPIGRVSYGVSTKVKWECRECGNKWQSKVNTLARRKSQKYCSKCEPLKKVKKEIETKKSEIRKKYTKDELYGMLTLEPNFEKIGRREGVSGNAVRKWCKILGIPHLTSYYLSKNK